MHYVTVYVPERIRREELRQRREVLQESGVHRRGDRRRGYSRIENAIPEGVEGSILGEFVEGAFQQPGRQGREILRRRPRLRLSASPAEISF